MIKLRPESVDQMLFLLTRIIVRCKAGDTVTEAQKTATRETSKKYHVEGPTISDLQTRRLEIKGIVKWRELLEDWRSGNSEPLINVILQHSETEQHKAIRGFFENSDMGMIRNNSDDLVEFEIDESFNFNTSQETSKKIKVMALMSGATESQWLEKNVQEMVSNKYTQWLESQKV